VDRGPGPPDEPGRSANPVDLRERTTRETGDADVRFPKIKNE
jgi:hypothetical protein